MDFIDTLVLTINDTIPSFISFYDQAFVVSGILLAGKKGSKYSKVRALKPGKKEVELTQHQKDVLVGTMLGDAHMSKDKEHHNPRVTFDQTFPMHASYLTVLYVIFMNLVGTPPRIVIRKADKRTGNVYSQIVFKTLAFPCLNVFYNMFYVNNIKVVPYNIGLLLNARALAYWIMDDGGKGSHGETILHTRSFTYAEVQLLQKVLMDNFQLSTRLSEKVAGQWVIIIPVKQKVPLKHIVSHHMCRSMLHKI